MAEQNWGRRVIDSRGGHFRIETGSPRQGRDGPEPTKIYSSNDKGEVFLIAHGHGTGLGRVACDKSIEINAGDKNDPNSIDIRVCAATGDVTITANRGRVRVHGKDLMFTADRDIDIKAGRNVNIQSSVGRILLKANSAMVRALRGNLVPETWGAKIAKNSFIPADILAKIFAPKAQNTQLGAAPGGFDGVAAGALKGYGFTLEDLGLTAQTGAVDAVENAKKAASSSTINPLQKASNLLSGDLKTSLSDALDSAGASDLKGQFSDVTGSLKDNLGLGGIKKISGDTSLADAGKNLLGGQLPGKGGAVDTIKGIGNKVLTGNISSLNSSAASALGVVEGGNSLTGLKKMFGTGSVAKGPAATIGNFSSDKLATLVGDVIPTHPDIPDEQKLKDVGNAVALRMENLAQDLLTASNTPNFEGELKENIEKKLLSGEEIIGDLKHVAESFKLE